MKKLLVTAAVALFAASPLFAMDEHDAKQKMEEGKDAVGDAYDSSKDAVKGAYESGKDSVSALFDRDSISEDHAKEIETKLSEAGFFQGEPDGKIEDDTIESLKKFQESKNITAKGEFNKETLDALGVDANVKQAQEAAE